MTEPQYIVFGAPMIGEEEIEEVVECLRSGWLGTGPRVARFETEFSAYQRVKQNQVAAVNSCTAALHVSLLAAGLELGSEVITTPLTFCASVNAIIHAGLTPVLADVDPISQCISPAAIEAAITPRTQAILPVHFAGRPCDMSAIMQIAEKYSLQVIEDCAHAIETEYYGKKVGTFGDFGCYSFYVTKTVCMGEGGMIIGRNEEKIARARVLALHGMDKDAWKRFSDDGYKHYRVTECGFKYNMMDLQAAIGVHQLARIERNWWRRQEIWQAYIDAFQDLPIGLPASVEPHTRHGLHLFTIRIESARAGMSRDDFIQEMHRAGIGTGVHYLSIPEHSYYQQRYGWQPKYWPAAMRIGRQTVSLPLSAKLSEQDQCRIIAAVKSALMK